MSCALNWKIMKTVAYGYGSECRIDLLVLSRGIV